MHMSHSRHSGSTATLPTATAVLVCEAAAAGEARRLVVAECLAAGLTQDARDQAELLVSEVVTNAVLHGRSAVHLRVLATPALLRVEVGDDNSRRPSMVRPDAGALGGRGMAIVDLLATRWGVEEGGIGKVVWFEITA